MADRKRSRRRRRPDFGPVNIPSYCPCCQRLYRTHPIDFTCPHDGTPLIFMDDPLPSTATEGGLSTITVVAVTAACLLIAMF